MFSRVFFTCTLFPNSSSFLACHCKLWNFTVQSLLTFPFQKLHYSAVHSLWKEDEAFTKEFKLCLKCVVRMCFPSPVFFTILMQLPDIINSGTRKLEVNQCLNCSSNKLLSEVYLTLRSAYYSTTRLLCVVVDNKLWIEKK